MGAVASDALAGAASAQDSAAPAPQASASAWLLHVGDEQLLAVGGAELVHVVSIDDIELKRVACAPAWCAHVMLWTGRPVPVLDVPARTQVDSLETTSKVTSGARLFALVHYEVAHHGDSHLAEVAIGAISLVQVPERVMVSDDMACELSGDNATLAPYSLAAFRLHGDNPVPVVDLARLFSAP